MVRARLYSLEKIVNSARDSKSSWNKTIEEAKLAIFGHQAGFVGEEEFLKPLQGPSRTRWYWPSKYMHMDFTLRHYLAMQISRFRRKEDDPAIINLWNTVTRIKNNKESIKGFLESVDPDTFSSSITIPDSHALYYLIHKESPLPFQTDDRSLSKFDDPKYLPFIKYALSGLNRKADAKKDIKSEVQLRSRLRLLLQEDPSIAKCLKVRNRFVDNLYLRRRNYYLDKVIRNKKVSETKQKYKRHFLTHPDEKTVWPDNKGIQQHRWPSI